MLHLFQLFHLPNTLHETEGFKETSFEQKIKYDKYFIGEEYPTKTEIQAYIFQIPRSLYNVLLWRTVIKSHMHKPHTSIMCNDSMDLQKQKLNKISLNLLKYIFYKGRL